MRVMEDDLSSKKLITLSIKDIPDLSSTIDVAEYRIDYATKVLSKAIPNLTNPGWTDVTESDPEYSDYTTCKVVGESAVEIANALIDKAKAGELKMATEKRSEISDDSDQIMRFMLPGFNDAQIFFLDASDASEDELVLVVRPLSIKKEVIIQI